MKYRLDMTPLVDVAFLLLTFFILTAEFQYLRSVPQDLPVTDQTNNISENADVFILSDSLANLYLQTPGLLSKDTLWSIFRFPSKISIEQSDTLFKVLYRTDSLVKIQLLMDKNYPYHQLKKLVASLKNNKLSRFTLLVE